MPKFNAMVITAEGRRSEETLDAPDRFAAYRILRERGGTVFMLKEKGGGIAALAALTGLMHRISMDEKVSVARNLAAMLEAGLTVSRALTVLDRQTKNQSLSEILKAIIADVKRGNAFSAALSPYERVFSPLMISMARAGEESGTLSSALRAVATQMERASTLEKRIRGALIYPSFVVVAMVGITILMLIYVVPTLASTFAQLNVALPWSTAFILAASSFFIHYSFAAAAVALLVAAGFWLFAHTEAGGKMIDWALLRIPVVGVLVMETDCARTSRTLASLLSSGVDVVSSLAITRDVVGNYFFKRALAETEMAVVKGVPLSDSFAKHPELYPPLLSEMIAVGEETGRLSELLGETATFYEDSVERSTKDLSSIIEPLLILLVGAMVGFFAISIIGPIYSLSNSIS